MQRNNEKGVALLLALLFVVLLTAIVVEYSYEISVEASLVENDEEDTQAYVAARSAAAAGIGLLIADVAAAAEAGQEYVALSDQWAQGIPNQQLNDATMRCTIVDECGKIDLNALAVQTDRPLETEEEGVRELLEATLRALFRNRTGDRDPTDAILDWMDPDDEPRPEGAENEYYAALDVPYACKNGPFDSVEELLLVRGVTLDLFFGLPDQDPPQAPLTELLTVHGHPQGLINANTAHRETLAAACEARYPGEMHRAETALARREENPFASIEDLHDLLRDPPPEDRDTPPPPEIFTIASDMFRVQGDGVTDATAVRVEAYVKRPSERDAEIVRVVDWRVMR